MISQRQDPMKLNKNQSNHKNIFKQHDTFTNLQLFSKVTSGDSERNGRRLDNCP